MEDPLFAPDFARCVAFHGHSCPGLALGFRVAREALARLGVAPSRDEEVVAVVENDTCAVDALQVLLGCTFGKGNLVFRDHGKLAFTVGSRLGGRSWRFVKRPGVLAATEEQRRLFERVRTGEATAAEEREAAEEWRRRTEEILTLPFAELYDVVEATDELPAPARILASAPCVRCGEEVMVTRLVEREGGAICRRCAGDR